MFVVHIYISCVYAYVDSYSYVYIYIFIYIYVYLFIFTHLFTYVRLSVLISMYSICVYIQICKTTNKWKKQMCIYICIIHVKHLFHAYIYIYTDRYYRLNK